MNDRLFRITLRTSAALAAVLEEALPAAGLPAAWCTDEETGDSRFELYGETLEEARRQETELKRLLGDLAGPDPWTIETQPLRREDWAEAWKAHFHAERVSPRIVIRPSWEAWTAAPDDLVITLDAGMSFGTGRHGTTRACLRFLDELAAEGRTGAFLDAGCGSGILAIAAARLGFAPIRAIDLDPAAVEVARANARLNGVEAAIRFEARDVRSLAADVTCACVAANIEAPLLLESADLIARLPAGPRAALLLAGILTPQYPQVRAAYSSRGLRERRTATVDEWTSGLFERP